MNPQRETVSAHKLSNMIDLIEREHFESANETI